MGRTRMKGRRVITKGNAGFLQNMGPVSTMWLREAGIETLEDLRSVGLEEAFRRMVTYGFNVNALMLYGMEGALRGIHWNAIGDARKEELKLMAARVKQGLR